MTTTPADTARRNILAHECNKILRSHREGIAEVLGSAAKTVLPEIIEHGLAIDFAAGSLVSAAVKAGLSQAEAIGVLSWNWPNRTFLVADVDRDCVVTRPDSTEGLAIVHGFPPPDDDEPVECEDIDARTFAKALPYLARFVRDHDPRPVQERPSPKSLRSGLPGLLTAIQHVHSIGAYLDSAAALILEGEWDHAADAIAGAIFQSVATADGLGLRLDEGVNRMASSMAAHAAVSGRDKAAS